MTAEMVFVAENRVGDRLAWDDYKKTLAVG